MSNKRNIAFAAVAVLALAGVALAAYPATADEETGAAQVSVEITSTFPRLQGVVTVVDGDGAPVHGAHILLESHIDGAEALPPAKGAGFTTFDGTFSFTFPYASTANTPGAHTLTATVTLPDNSTVAASQSYTVLL